MLNNWRVIYKLKMALSVQLVWLIFSQPVFAAETEQERQATEQLNRAYEDATRSATCGYILESLCTWAISTASHIENIWPALSNKKIEAPVVVESVASQTNNSTSSNEAFSRLRNTGCADGASECEGKADYRRIERSPVFETDELKDPASVVGEKRSDKISEKFGVSADVLPPSSSAQLLNEADNRKYTAPLITAPQNEKLVVNCSCDATFSLDNKMHRNIKVVVELSKSSSCEHDAEKWRNSNPPPLTKKDIVCRAQSCRSSEPYLEKIGYVCVEPDGTKWRDTAAGKKWRAGK